MGDVPLSPEIEIVRSEPPSHPHGARHSLPQQVVSQISRYVTPINYGLEYPPPLLFDSHAARYSQPYGECRVMRDTRPSTAPLQFAPLSIGGHPSRFQSPRNVQQHSFGGPHVCSDVLVSGPPQGHDDKWEATDGKPHTSSLKLEVKHTHGRSREGDT